MNKIDPYKLSGPLSLDVALEHGKLLDKVFRVKDIDVDPKIFHTWRMAGVLDMIDGGKWASLSFIDYLWVCTLESLRKFGSSRNLMKKIHNELFIKAREMDLGRKTLNENITFLEKLSEERQLTIQESDYLTASRHTLQDDKVLKSQRKEITYFYQLVLRCFTENAETGLIIYENESFVTYVEEPDADLSIPHIRMPFTSFIKRFLDDEKKDRFFEKTGIINEQEMQILKAIRNKNLKSISIFFNSDQGIHKIECNESGILDMQDSKIIMHTLGMKNYQSLELNTRDGKTISYTITKRNYM